MLKRAIGLALGWLAVTAMQAPAPAPAEISLWRLDCGEIDFAQYGAFFSDTYQYPPGAKTLVASCYLIRHGDRYMLWDAGLTDALIPNGFSNPTMTLRLRRGLLDQLRQIDVRPEQIETIGISHWHFDHTGQARHFPRARLLIGAGDVEMLRRTPSPDQDATDSLAHWLSGEGRLEAIRGDRDIFGDGRIVMLSMPGHTPGHYSLLVRLASGPVLLSGDLWHFTEQVENRGVPPFNHDRADSLASMDRYERIARNLGARSIIQHEPADVARLPTFPEAAR